MTTAAGTIAAGTTAAGITAAGTIAAGITDSGAPGAPDVLVGIADEPGAVEVELRPAHPVLAGDSGQGHSPAKLRYEQFHTVEPEAVHQFFADAYRPGWAVSELTSRSAVSHRRCESGLIAVDEVLVQGRLAFEIPPADTVVVIQPRAGSLAVTGRPFRDVGCPVLVAHGMSCLLRVNGARFDVVSIAAEALHKVATGSQAPPSQIRFLDWRPRSHSSVRAWHRALDYVTATLSAADTAEQPLVVAAMAPLLAGALLECYPSNATEHDLASDPALPETLKQAVAFIHSHAAAEVSINDVAAAVHLTPRAVQYLFRRRLDTTPTEYMRRVRLHRAHQELRACEPSDTTVGEIAQRWGFAHAGRFAVLYRQAYGQSPHATLKQ